jgi:hypothetical protein
MLPVVQSECVHHERNEERGNQNLLEIELERVTRAEISGRQGIGGGSKDQADNAAFAQEKAERRR